MTPRESRRLIICDRVGSERDYLLDLQVSKQAVVPIPTFRFGEKSEEQKHIANPDAVVREVSLCGSGLTERAPATFKHGIVMAKAGACNSPPGCGFDNLR